MCKLFTHIAGTADSIWAIKDVYQYLKRMDFYDEVGWATSFYPQIAEGMAYLAIGR